MCKRQFQQLMTDNGVVGLRGRSGNVRDNAATERFVSSLKTERVGKKAYRSRDEARAVLFDDIDGSANPLRRRSTIGYLSPVEYERKMGLA